MNYIIQTTKLFEKELSILKKSKSKIADKVFQTIIRLSSGPLFEEVYNVHKLTGNYGGNRSINVTGDYRMVFSIDTENKIIVLRFIGTHSQLYG